MLKLACLISFSCLGILWPRMAGPQINTDGFLSSFPTFLPSSSEKEPSPPKTPAQELATFQVEPGFKIQLVAAEPMVQDPIVIMFDPNGRLWVVEMRGFMNDIEGSNEAEPIGRISVLEDTNGDGQMDKSTVYLDSLVMPRALALVPGGALVAENKALWLTQDTDGDLRADTKILLDQDYAKNGLPEHADNGFWRSVDNWYYNAKSRFRYRLTHGKWQRDSTEMRGQWGMSHDDEGHLYYNYNWSQLHADLVPPNYLSRNPHHTPTTGIDHGLTIDRRVYPIRPNPAVNRGYIPGTLSDDGKLLEFTAACSPLVYRENAFPIEYLGNAFVCEPAGNLVKRNVVRKNGLTLIAFDPHPGKEFLASIDERFRPVHLASAPDGGLYIADMYRGLVQHGAYMTPYLKAQTIERNLVQPVHYGRIWRVVPKDWRPSKPKKLSQASSNELVATLSHPDGWQRDQAQRLLVERNDSKAVILLQDLVKNGDAPLGRFHALWTLEGMNQLNDDLLFKALNDENSLVKSTALKLLEPRAKDNTTRIRLEAEFVKFTQFVDGFEDKPFTLQLALSANALSPKATHTILAHIIDKEVQSPLIRDAVLSSLKDQEFAFLQTLKITPNWGTQHQDKEIFLEMLTTSIIRKGNGDELALLLDDLNKAPFDWQKKTILTALSIQANNPKSKPIKLAKAPAILSRQMSGIDNQRINSLNALFEWPGHKATVTAAQKNNPLSEDDRKIFALGRQHYLTTCAGCHGTDGAGMNRFAPPLIGSQWVLGDEKRLSLILLHGMEGPVDVMGKTYDAPEILPVMPAHSTMDDGSLTAILTYIRNEWGNDAGAMDKRTVGTTRITSQGRVIPWTAKELDAQMKKIDE